ncbi:MAG: PrsW family intramembrane metalloprotease, partial [Saprospiraceae bacterium]|nr:PrsW family intramembrane metalloprotease [Saprospiraceae bacterium]
MNILGYIFAVLPSLLIIAVAIRNLKKRPWSWLAFALALGFISVVPALYFERIEFLLGDQDSDAAWKLWFVAFILVGFGEEFFKLLVLFAFQYFSGKIKNIRQGIVYSVLIAMGFALIENIIYAYIYPFSTIVVRSFTAVPAHAVFAIILGYFFGMAQSGTKLNWPLIGRGLLFASLLHGTYDWFILQHYKEWLTSGALLI